MPASTTCPSPCATSTRRRGGDRRLGFALKPGRPHANGIRNLHAKFPDGTELELITAAKATDDLTHTYVAHLEKGDGPAFLALFSRPPVCPRSPAPAYVFFGGRNPLAHGSPRSTSRTPNTADSLAAVWLAGDLAAERRLLKAAGAVLEDRVVPLPDLVPATIAPFVRGRGLAAAAVPGP